MTKAAVNVTVYFSVLWSKVGDTVLESQQALCFCNPYRNAERHKQVSCTFEKGDRRACLKLGGEYTIQTISSYPRKDKHRLEKNPKCNNKVGEKSKGPHSR